MSKRKISVEDKLYAVNLYLDGKESQHRIVSIFDVNINVHEELKSSGAGGSAIMTKGRKTTFE